MATLRPDVQPSPIWMGRLAEWSVLVLLLLAAATVFVRQLSEVRGQAELAQIRSTLGALRTALVIAHLEAAAGRSRISGVSATPAQPNPFLELAVLPANYAGLANPEVLSVLPGGSWAFDPACACIGYHPMDIDRLESPAGAQTLWFQVTGKLGPLQINPQLHYIWMGQAIE